jgi:hypothetical protein
MSSMITTTIILATAIVWLIWDLYLYFSNKETISQKIIKWNKISIMICFLFGFLMGHWFG